MKEATYALLTHSDLDACVSGILARHLYPVAALKWQGYSKVDKSLAFLADLGLDNLVTTDICLTGKQIDYALDNFDNVIYVDHHKNSEEFSNYKWPGLEAHVTMEKSSSGIVYDMLVEKADKPFKHLRPMAYLTNIYDMWQTTSPLWERARELDMLYWNMKYEAFAVKFFEGIPGVWDAESQVTIDHIKAKRKDLVHGSQSISMAHDSAIFFCQDASVVNEYTLEFPDHFVYFVVRNRGGANVVSIRRGDKYSVDLNDMIIKTGNEMQGMVKNGGGHEAAAGLEFEPSVTRADIFKFLERANEIAWEMEPSDD